MHELTCVAHIDFMLSIMTAIAESHALTTIILVMIKPKTAISSDTIIIVYQFDIMYTIQYLRRSPKLV
ncbi:hypothetical protein GJV44_00304 [Candidatus Vallotia cooleyia]|nr:hypothetical protein GJV44_00304 [Candidatus Vallotia cooleyia]